MGNKRKYAVLGSIVLLIAIVNLFIFFNPEISYSSLSGQAINEDVNLPLNIKLTDLIFYGQWIILAVIVFFIYTSFMKSKKEEQTVNNLDINVSRKKKKSETDLDVLYNLLKDKKELSINAIAVAFKIPKSKAMGWAKILETHDLGTIDYPAFSDPTIKLKQENENIDSRKKDINSKKEKLNSKKVKQKPIEKNRKISKKITKKNNQVSYKSIKKETKGKIKPNEKREKKRSPSRKT